MGKTKIIGKIFWLEKRIREWTEVSSRVGVRPGSESLPSQGVCKKNSIERSHDWDFQGRIILMLLQTSLAAVRRPSLILNTIVGLAGIWKQNQRILLLKSHHSQHWWCSAWLAGWRLTTECKAQSLGRVASPVSGPKIGILQLKIVLQRGSQGQNPKE